MKSLRLIFVIISMLSAGENFFAQNNLPAPNTSQPVESGQKFSEIISKNQARLQEKSQVSSEQRRQAYVKLLEGQRYIWNISRFQRSPAAVTANAKLAKQSLQKAVELDPTLAEAYTALADLSKNTPPYDINEAISLANVAVRINPDNFGAHQILAQLYTFNSKINRGVLDAAFAQKAINEWKEIARLDPRNAEAFAFLSEFYALTNQTEERVKALKSWLASNAPNGDRFYGRIFQGESLAPQSAAVKLGDALIKAGQNKQAVEILSSTVVDDPENSEAIELLREALETADANSSAAVVQSLQQAIFANPSNASLIALLAQVQARSWKISDAAKTISEATGKLIENDKISAADLQIILGDIYLQANRFNEAVAAYENALTVRGIGKEEPVLENERDFAARVFGKIIDTYKTANRPDDAKAVIEQARRLLGKTDLFAEKQLISLYRETGNKTEALNAIRSLRQKNPDDYALLRLEATILTESGKISEAVALVKTLLNKRETASANSVNSDGTGNFTISTQQYDDFSNLLFISNLYSQAQLGKEAVEAANQAYKLAGTEEKKQIAKLTLATALQRSGDFRLAEETLRSLLKQSPGNPIALNNLGYFLAERNANLDEALALIQQAVRIEPSNPSYLDSLGWTYFKLGKFDEAEKYLKNAARFAASSATIQEHLGDVYQKQGKSELAAAAWLKAASLSTDQNDINRIKSKLTKKPSR